MRRKIGFTLIEISLFIALSAALFVVATVGVQNSLNQQRYSDSVQRFAEFIKNIYSEVNNVQNNATGGKTDKVIYGKMVTFGEEKDFNGSDNNDKKIFVYNVIGGDCLNSGCGGGGTIEELKALGASVFVNEKYAGMVYDYSMKWSASLQDKEGYPFKGTLLVVRNPESGIVSTFVNNTINVNELNDGSRWGEFDLSGFGKGEINFCISPDGGKNNRANVRIESGARNSTGVNIYYDTNNKCN